MTGQWKRYAESAIVELVAAAIGRVEDAAKRLQTAYEDVDRAMESLELEREEHHGNG